MRSTTLALASLAATIVSAHGNITSPPSRLPGPKMLQVCGQTAVDTVLSDGTIALEEVKASSAACNVGLCRGAQFEDNAANVQTFSLGQVVILEVALPIPHAGPANVSIVSTKTNSIVGDILLFFPIYADEKASELPANNTVFGVTLPTGKDGEAVKQACKKGGDCVLQWWWLGTEAKQTYESCVDFVLAGGVDGARVNREAIEKQNLGGKTGGGGGQGGGQSVVVVPSGGGGKGGAVGSVGEAAPSPSPVSNEAVAVPVGEVAEVEVDGSFGGIDGVVPVGEGSEAVVEGSFGGELDTVPISARSRVFRGRV